MEFLSLLWLPILISGVVLFIASSVAWTMMPHHKTDWKKTNNEDELMSAIGKFNMPAGSYMFPFMTHGEESKGEACMEKYVKGPRGLLILWDMPSMGANMFFTFLYFLATATIIAYVSHAALGNGKEFMKVFQVVGTIGMLTYSCAGIPHAIWFKRRVITDIMDGIVYGVLIGLVFALRWPV